MSRYADTKPRPDSGGGMNSADASSRRISRSRPSSWFQSNSNGGQVMMTVDTRLAAMVNQQLDARGGGMCLWCAPVGPTIRASRGVPFMADQDYFSQGFAGFVVQRATLTR